MKWKRFGCNLFIIDKKLKCVFVSLDSNWIYTYRQDKDCFKENFADVNIDSATQALHARIVRQLDKREGYHLEQHRFCVAIAIKQHQGNAGRTNAILVGPRWCWSMILYFCMISRLLRATSFSCSAERWGHFKASLQSLFTIEMSSAKVALRSNLLISLKVPAERGCHLAAPTLSLFTCITFAIHVTKVALCHCIPSLCCELASRCRLISPTSSKSRLPSWLYHYNTCHQDYTAPMECAALATCHKQASDTAGIPPLFSLYPRCVMVHGRLDSLGIALQVDLHRYCKDRSTLQPRCHPQC